MAWQNEKHYSKENNTSENPIPRREIFKSVDHVKYEGQVRSSQVKTFVVCAVFSLSFQAVVLLKGGFPVMAETTRKLAASTR